MTARRVYVLLALAIAVIATALWVSSQRHLPRDVDIGNKLFVALKKNELTEIDLSKAGMKRMVTLKSNGNEWTVAERDAYAADASKVRALVLGVADLKIIEEKTSDPNNYSALGIEDIAKPSASGIQIDLKNATGSDSLIVGRVSGGQTAFVRKPGSARSYLVAPQIYADAEAKNWLHRPIVDVASDRIQQASVTTGKLPYVLARKSRAQANFELASAPRGKALSSETAGNVVGGALAALELDDVRKQDAAHWQSPADRTEIRSFDGWVIGIDGRVDGDQHWIRLTSRYDEALARQFPPLAPAPAAKDAPPPKPQPDVSKDAQALAEKSAAWEYEIPKYKYDALFKPLDEIVKKP